MFWAIFLGSIGLIAAVVVMLSRYRTYGSLAVAIFAVGMLACCLATYRVEEASAFRIWQIALLLSELSGIAGIVSLLRDNGRPSLGP